MRKSIHCGFLVLILISISFLQSHLAFGEGLTFQPIYFERGQSKITEAAKEALDRITGLLKSNPKATLRLEGHATGEKPKVKPEDLALIRAKVTADYLKAKGIAPTRLNPQSFFDESIKRLDPKLQQSRRVDFTFFTPAPKVTDEKLEPINVVYWNTLYHCLYQIAVDQGYFRDEGFKVQLIATNHSYVNQVNASCGIEPFLEEGERIFTGAVCGGSPHDAIAKGVPLVVIGGMLAGGSMLIASKKMAAYLRADWKNFKGITIGRPKGTILTSMIVAYNIAKRAGIDPQKDVKWKEYGTHEDVLEAIVKGEVDAGDTYAPLNLTAERKFGLVTVYNTVELFPYHPCCRIITTKSKLKKNRGKYVRFLKAVIRAHEYFIKQPAKAIDIVARYTGYEKADVLASLTNPNFLLNPDPLKHGFVKFWNMMLETGYIKSDKDINKFIDVTIYQDALKELSEKDPKNPYYRHMMRQFVVQNL